MNLLHAISVAMDESVDQRRPYIPENEDCDFIIYAHQELAKRQVMVRYWQSPFRIRESVFGAITQAINQ